MKFDLLLIMACLSLFACSNKKTSKEQTAINYCALLDTVEMDYELSGTNFHMNVYIPLIEKGSNIISAADKGTFGYLYKSEASLKGDMIKWRLFFKCH